MPKRRRCSGEYDDDGNTNTIVAKSQKNLPVPDTYGLNKVPTVVLERLNIAPLNTTSRTNIPSSERRKSLIEKHPVFFSKVQVRLERCEQETLKQTHKISSAFEYRCKICDKRYPEEENLRNHHDNEHLTVHGPLIIKPQKRVSFSDHVVVHEYHKCRKCTQTFESYHLLKKHKIDNHIKRKCYICDYCTMNFDDRKIFKKHVKLHCDVCQKLLPNQYQYQEHRRLVCNNGKKSFQFIKINFDLSKQSDVKEHSFACKQCDELLSNKCSFQDNKSILHLGIRPDELLETKNNGKECVYVCLFYVKHK